MQKGSDNVKRYPFGVLGAGKMGMAIAVGATMAGIWHESEILLFNRSEEKQKRNRGLGFAVTAEIAEVYASCDRVVLGVKPQNFNDILLALKGIQIEKQPLLISIAAGVPFSKIETALGANTPIVRVMPNTPLLLGEGASALVKNNAATDAQLTEVARLFRSMGQVAVFEQEDMLNEVIPYNGSLPAFVYQFMDAFLKSANAHGIAREQALPLICQTVIGSAKMVLQGEKSPSELISDVCSPGGTTIEGVRVFEKAGLDEIVANASDQTIKRAYELGKAD